MLSTVSRPVWNQSKSSKLLGFPAVQTPWKIQSSKLWRGNSLFMIYNLSSGMRSPNSSLSNHTPTASNSIHLPNPIFLLKSLLAPPGPTEFPLLWWGLQIRQHNWVLNYVLLCKTEYCFHVFSSFTNQTTVLTYLVLPKMFNLYLVKRK